jgi:deoxycytidylate deaminase
MCAKLIIATGIKNVYYISEYEPSGLTLLEEAGVKTYRIITKEQHQE